MLDVPLAHGYSLADLHVMARIAVHTAGSMAADWRDRYDLAWSAIAEQLYAADQPPPRHSLIQAGQLAIYRDVDEHRHAHGYRDRRWDAGPGSAPRYAVYWQPRVTPSPEGEIVDRLTLPRLLAALTRGQRQALAALAVHGGDRIATAAALGLNVRALNFQIRTGRARCLALWLEGETPACRPRRRPDHSRLRKAAS